MKLLLLLLVPAVLSIDPQGVCLVNNRILGGEKADKSQFPGLVYIQKYFHSGSQEYMTSCAGSLISDHFVLTAAHCVTGKPGEVIRAILVYPTKGVSSNIQSVGMIVHEEYRYYNNIIFNDIALIRLPVPMSTIDPSIKITPLPVQDQRLTSNEVTLVGWGVTSTTNAANPPYLMKKEHVPIRQDLCQRSGHSPNEVLCSYPTYATGTTCPGDSGGPIFMDGVQVGIVSHAAPVRYAIFFNYILQIDTRVSGYRNWIDAQIRAHTP